MYALGCHTFDPDCSGSQSGCIYLFTDMANGEWGGSQYSIGNDTITGRYKVPLPYGVSVVGQPASYASYGGRTYICGWASYNLVLDEHHRLWKQGIRGPEAPPTITGAAGSGAIAYISWYDEMTAERSPLSQGAVISTATPRTWTLPSQPPDDIFISDGTVTYGTPIVPDSLAAKTFFLRPGDRVGFPDQGTGVSYNMVDEVGADGEFTVDGSGAVGDSGVVALPFSRATHCELWLSVAGGLPQLVMQVPKGMTSVTESISTSDLGESYIGSFERFPRCSMNVIWNDRQILAGDPDNPDTIYMSDLFYPERYAGLNFRTKDGAPVTGILALRDYCLIFSRDKTYMLQGYTESDFSFSMIEQSLGSIGHSCNTVVHGAGYVWTEKGPYMFNGSWHPLSPDNLFSPPIPSTDPNPNGSRAVVDPDSNVYMLVSDGVGLVDRYVSYTSIGVPDVFVLDYTTVQPEVGGAFAPARLSFDTQYIPISDPGGKYLYHYVSNKWGFGALYTMSASDSLEAAKSLSGHSFFVFQHRRMNQTTYEGGTPRWTNDPGSLYVTHPSFKVVLGHYLFDDPGGSVMEGKAFKRLWVDARTYDDGATLEVYPGDDDALEIYFGRTYVIGWDPPASGAPVSFDLPKHYVGIGAGGEGAVSSVLKFSLDRVTGRGISLVFTAPNLGLGASFRGFGGAFIEGPASRYGWPIEQG